MHRISLVLLVPVAVVAVALFVVGVGIAKQVKPPANVPQPAAPERTVFLQGGDSPASTPPPQTTQTREAVYKIDTGLGTIYYMIRGRLTRDAAQKGSIITTQIIVDGDPAQASIGVSIDSAATGLAVHSTSLDDGVDSEAAPAETFLRVLKKGAPVSLMVNAGSAQTQLALQNALENAAGGHFSFLSHFTLTPTTVDAVENNPR